MVNPPKKLIKSQIDNDVKPTIYLDIKDKPEDIVKNKLQFYINNCLSIKFTNAAYSYSYSRAAIDVICYFKDWNVPEVVLENDQHRKDNPDMYYSKNSMKPNKKGVRKKTTKKKSTSSKSSAACRNKDAAADPNNEFPITVSVRPKHRPTSSVLFKRLMNAKK